MKTDLMDMEATIDRLQDNMERLLKVIGAKHGRCSSAICNAEIVWVRTAMGRLSPYDPDGVPHWATCKDKEKFRRDKEKANG